MPATSARYAPLNEKGERERDDLFAAGAPELSPPPDDPVKIAGEPVLLGPIILPLSDVARARAFYKGSGTRASKGSGRYICVRCFVFVLQARAAVAVDEMREREREKES